MNKNTFLMVVGMLVGTTISLSAAARIASPSRGLAVLITAEQDAKNALEASRARSADFGAVRGGGLARISERRTSMSDLRLAAVAYETARWLVYEYVLQRKPLVLQAYIAWTAAIQYNRHAEMTAALRVFARDEVVRKEASFKSLLEEAKRTMLTDEAQGRFIKPNLTWRSTLPSE